MDQVLTKPSLSTNAYNLSGFKLANKTKTFNASSIQLKTALNRDTITFTKKQTPGKPYTEKIFSIPDFKQLDEKLPDGGTYSCGPVSASNALIHLNNSGFNNLTKDKDHFAVIDEISKYCKFDIEGITVSNMCLGLDKFVKDRGYKIKKLEFQGFRPLDKYHSGKVVPNIDEIKKAIEKNSVVLLYVGLYKKPKIENGKTIYERIDGHWATLAGHSFNGKTFDPNCLVVHDPYAKNNGKINNNYYQLQKIHQGTIIPSDDDNESTTIQDAKGFYRITSGIDYYMPPEELSILDGAVILELERP